MYARLCRARRRIVRAGLTAALVAAVAPAPSVAADREGYVESFDGTRIIYRFMPAAGLGAGARAPTIFVGHGYGGSHDSDPESASAEGTGYVGVGPLRHAGYNVLTWDARGFGGSGGRVSVDGPDFEARDVQALIAWVARQPEAQLDGPGDPRMGMSGASYGGGIQLVTAGIDRRVDVITPDIAWHSLLTSLYKDQTVKSGWGAVLAGAGEATSALVGLFGGPGGPQAGSQDPHIHSALVTGASLGTWSDEDVEWFRSRGPGDLVKRIRIPTLLMQGTVDTLFTLQEAIDNFEILRGLDVPAKMIWFCGGHGVCSINPGEPGRLQKAVLTWFARYLKGDNSVDTGPRFEWLADDGKWRTASDYPVPTASPLTASGPGSLALTAGATSGQLIAAGPAAPGTPVINLPIPAPKAPAQLVGPPVLSLTYTGTAALADTRVYAQVVDLGANLVLGNQVTPIPVMLDGAEHTVRRRLEPIAASASPASRYVLQIVPGTTVYDPQRSAGVLNAARIKIDLPVLGTLSPGPALGAGRRAACRRGSRVIVRLREPRGAERIVVARFYVGAKRVRTVRGSALRRVIRLRVSRRAKRLRVMATTDRGRTLRSTRRLRRCT